MTKPVLTIIVPCYNEEEALLKTNEVLSQCLNTMVEKGLINSCSFITYVDDGSKDTTWKLIEQLSNQFKNVHGIKLSRNFGHQNALLAGLSASLKSDCTITIDADLQDDVAIIPKFLERFNTGFDVVYGVRNNRDTDSWFKKVSAESFYGLMKRLGVDMIPNHADFRLLSQRALQSLLAYHEDNLFYRGLIPLMGFSSTQVFYRRKKRVAGVSKYPFKKMVNFALNGITSFSTFPLTLVFYFGIFATLVSIILFIYTIIQKIYGDVVPGWSSLMISMWFLGGIMLFSISIVGQYIGKIFKETKHRPKYFIEKKI
ncbi:glycosyltransferase family 2 protein [Enterococcus sp. LJL90]